MRFSSVQRQHRKGGGGGGEGGGKKEKKRRRKKKGKDYVRNSVDVADWCKS